MRMSFLAKLAIGIYDFKKDRAIITYVYQPTR